MIGLLDSTRSSGSICTDGREVKQKFLAQELGDPVSGVLKRSAALVRVQTTILRIFIHTESLWLTMVRPTVVQVRCLCNS